MYSLSNLVDGDLVGGAAGGGHGGVQGGVGVVRQVAVLDWPPSEGECVGVNLCMAGHLITM